jgi:glycine/D-amino acid oxidase-like deaminating enzyme
VRVTLVDAYGPGNERSSSGGETRLMREDYGDRELYMRLAIRAFALWRKYQAQWKTRLFTETGRLLMASSGAIAALQERASRLRRNNVATELLGPDELSRRWPQMFTADTAGALYNPKAALLHARDDCRAVAAALVSAGGKLLVARARPRRRDHRACEVEFNDGTRLSADIIVFACGPWLKTLFPALFSHRFRVIRRDVLFFGTPANDPAFSLPNLPTWGFEDERDDPMHRSASTSFSAYYGFPDLEGRGVKVCPIDKDVEADPDTLDRRVAQTTIDAARAFLAHRFPRLAGQPVVGTRVCQTTDTSTADFVIDRHPEWENVWIAGGGSGHGFKHGPAIGEYLAARIVDGKVDQELDEAFRLRPQH